MPYKEDENGIRVTNGYDLRRLWGSHREIMRMHAYGADGRQIAEHLDVTPQTVYNVLGCDIAQDELARYHALRDSTFADIQDKLHELAGVSVDIIEQTMIDPTTPTKQRTDLANKILDRVGHAPVQRFSTSTVSATVTPELLKSIRERTEELKTKLVEVE